MRVSVELGRVRLCIHDLLALSRGSIVELDRLAGEPLDVMVNDKVVARGEAVVINGKMGVRITEILAEAWPTDNEDKDLERAG